MSLLYPFYRCENGRWPGIEKNTRGNSHCFSPTHWLRAKGKCLPALLPWRNAGREGMKVTPEWSRDSTEGTRHPFRKC